MSTLHPHLLRRGADIMGMTKVSFDMPGVGNISGDNLKGGLSQLWTHYDNESPSWTSQISRSFNESSPWFNENITQPVRGFLRWAASDKAPWEQEGRSMYGTGDQAYQNKARSAAQESWRNLGMHSPPSNSYIQKQMDRYEGPRYDATGSLVK